MNERIKELMEQSMPAIDWNARHGVELDNGERLKHMTDWFDKFAQLIVRECLQQCEQIRDDAYTQKKSEYLTESGRLIYEGVFGGATNCGFAIQQHFGVEE
jgi:hypothetical protein